MTASFSFVTIIVMFRMLFYSYDIFHVLPYIDSMVMSSILVYNY